MMSFWGFSMTLSNSLKPSDPETNSETPLKALRETPLTHDASKDEGVPHHRNPDGIDGIQGAYTSMNGYHSEHPFSTSHVSERRPEKQVRSTTLSSSKRIKLDNH